MFDYGFAFFLLVSIANAVAIYLILIWQSENTLKLITSCEGFIGASKYCIRNFGVIIRVNSYQFVLYFSLFVHQGAHSTAAYAELIGKIELFNKVLGFGLFITIALLLLTVAPYTLVRYRMLNMGEESFYLFLPVWFVFRSMNEFKQIKH